MHRLLLTRRIGLPHSCPHMPVPSQLYIPTVARSFCVSPPSLFLPPHLSPGLLSLLTDGALCWGGCWSNTRSSSPLPLTPPELSKGLLHRGRDLHQVPSLPPCPGRDQHLQQLVPRLRHCCWVLSSSRSFGRGGSICLPHRQMGRVVWRSLGLFSLALVKEEEK